MSLLVGILSVLMGFILGLLGGGGSILTVPLLVYVAAQEPSAAIATSLLVVGLTSGISMLTHARLGNVRWRTGSLFGAVAMAGAYVGGHLAGYFSGPVLLILFACIMVVAGGVMLRPKKSRSGDESDVIRPFRPVRISVQAFPIGAITGLVGAGGGFIVVPTLVLLGGLGMRAAVGTSLLVITMNAFSGLAGHLSHAQVDLELALFVSGLAVVGALLGSFCSTKVQPAALRRVFGAFVILMAIVIVWKEVYAT